MPRRSKQSFTARELHGKCRLLAGEVETSAVDAGLHVSRRALGFSSYGWAKLEEARPGFTSAAVPEHVFRHRQERSRTPYSLNPTPRLTVTHSACIKKTYMQAAVSLLSLLRVKIKNHPLSR